MKIGIVTQPLSRNYGGILQNYALQQTLKKLGHEPYTFDLIASVPWYKWAKHNIKVLFKRAIGRKGTFRESPLRVARTEIPLRRFVMRNIALLAPRTAKPKAAQVRKYGLEALVVGSDQVWRPRYNRHIADMYLRFALSFDVRRIAYAASFGTGVWEYRRKKGAVCRALAQRFDAISVREDSAVRLCKEHLGVDAKHVLDPTLLLTNTEYNTLLDAATTPREDYLFAYLLDRSSQKIEHINAVAAQRGLKAVIVGVGADVKPDDSIERWLTYFRDCRYVVTDSFHGSVFSIIYNKDFHVIANIERGVDRMTSLLGALELNDRLVDAARLSDFRPLAAVEWERVNRSLDALREDSINFLRDNLA